MAEPSDLLLVFLATRAGADDQLGQRLSAERERWQEFGEAEAFLRLAKDPFREFTPGMRGFDATLELHATPNRLAEAVAGLGQRLDGVVHRDLCALVVGQEHTFVSGGPTPVRYQYLMRRRHDFDHERYIAHYGTHHAGLGIRTGGKVGYSQVHSALDRSKALAATEGFGVCQIDSVSRLWIDSVEGFLSEAGPAGQEAVEDERGFVDGTNSVMFASTVLS
jgi:hypothetical protein